MKPVNSTNDPYRFSGHIRYYHRRVGKQRKSWDEWVEGKPAPNRVSKKRRKIALVTVAILAVAGIIVSWVLGLG